MHVCRESIRLSPALSLILFDSKFNYFKFNNGLSSRCSAKNVAPTGPNLLFLRLIVLIFFLSVLMNGLISFCLKWLFDKSISSGQSLSGIYFYESFIDFIIFLPYYPLSFSTELLFLRTPNVFGAIKFLLQLFS